jgi:type IV secretion system protein VirB8
MTDLMPEERETRFAEIRTWALDRSEALAKWARAGWIVAGVATTVAVLQAFALMSIAPLKTVVPYTLLVDRTTGYTQTLEGLHPQTIKPQAALSQSLLAQYVVARESYDVDSIKGQYHRVGLWSAGSARRDYLASIQATNPESPINIYPRGALLDAKVSSVDAPSEGKAKVRFITERRDTQTGASERTWWVAEIDYRFTREPMEAADRLINPLGFTVTRYRRFQETPPSLPQTEPNARTDDLGTAEPERQLPVPSSAEPVLDDPL